ncbi:MAG: lysophospholipid acyltransferase family protein [Hyphomicrobiaceae bacterium]|nr:lysophospholipid acyltransferase family protein [Hyphomicrobiaceae bacterium]
MTDSGGIRHWLGRRLAGYLRLLGRTTRLVAEPADYADWLDVKGPYVLALWHGQHFITPLGIPPGTKAAVMISRSADGDINAIAAEAMGVRTVRASGGLLPHQIKKRGGARGLIEAMRLLRDGYHFAVTADVPKGPAKVVGPGIIALARHAGFPILPVAMATTYSITLPSWDSAALNLPFGRMALVIGEPMTIPADLADDAVAALQAELAARLDAATLRARQLARR